MRDSLRAPVQVMIVIGIAASMLACTSGGAASGSTAASPALVTLAETSWVLTSIEDVPVPDGVEATLVFAATDVSGSGGCNTFNGTYALEGPSLTFGPLATTRMACEEPANGIETAYLAALQGVTEWQIPQDAPMGTELTLMGTGEKLTFAGAS
jgi:heat shock protein HslJ